jgi:hypothetical protein
MRFMQHCMGAHQRHVLRAPAIEVPLHVLTQVLLCVTGATDAVGIAVPPAGTVSKIRRGGSMQCCLCERPGTSWHSYTPFGSTVDSCFGRPQRN